ncbi:MAG: alpha/beta hydrolase-fold protein, partial [candidate division KSB1 bacterium]|nr:alpha/beta hydrolase-fold protein [candidate division KSB1 bacterium]
MQILFMLSLVISTLQNGKVNDREITFEVIVPDAIAPNDTIFITGNVVSLGQWRPNAIPMTQISKNTWQITVMLPQHQTIEYKFTRGSWDCEEVLADGTVPGNKYLVVTRKQKIQHRIANWKDLLARPFGGIVGKLEYHHHFHSTQLENDRTILVWLPESYATQPQRRYPVLYMHDGQNLFDPKTSFIGVDWQMDE